MARSTGVNARVAMTAAPFRAQQQVDLVASTPTAIMPLLLILPTTEGIALMMASNFAQLKRRGRF